MKRMGPEEEAMYRRILMLCRSRGEDPVTALNSAGMLRHKATIETDWLDAIQALADSIEMCSFAKVQGLPLVIRTEMDLKRFLRKFVEGTLDSVKETIANERRKDV